MAKEEQSLFSYSKAQKFEFTEEEYITSRLLPDLNLKYIKSVLADYALTRALMRVDDSSGTVDLQKFAMESEYQRGAIEALSYIIANHEAAEDTIHEEMKAAIEKANDPRFRDNF